MDCSEELFPVANLIDESEGGKKGIRGSGTLKSNSCNPVESNPQNGNGHFNYNPTVSFKTLAARNLNEVNFTDLLNIEENGINQFDFDAFAESSAVACTKEATYTIQNIMAFISSSKESKIDTVGRADICRREGRFRLTSNKGQLQEIFGYEIGNETYLYAEEVLYLLERGKLEAYCDHVCLSVERARALLLHSKLFPENQSNIKTCDIDEFAVYKYLTRLGMRVRRHKNKECLDLENTNSGSTAKEESVQASEKPCASNENMDVDGDEPTVLQNSTPDHSNQYMEHSRGVKRKLDEDTEFSEVSTSANAVSENYSEASFDVNDEEMEERDYVSSLPGFREVASNYTVVEVDSDVEIEDMEPANGGVVIEEVPEESSFGVNSPREEMPCSSKTARLNLEPQIFVDLPSSDSECDEEKSYVNQIWSKFIPGVSLQIGFPPNHLLPSSIGSRSEEYQYNFTAHSSDLDLEYFVDELDLNESCLDRGEKIHCTSWSEWRQIMIQEAKEVRSSSLLGTSDFKLSNAAEKLNLWDSSTSVEESQHSADKKDGHNLVKVFDIFSHSCRTVHKRRLAAQHTPNFHLAIVGSDEPVPHLKELCHLENDIPIVIAIVSDENEILFLTPESVPLTSLF